MQTNTQIHPLRKEATTVAADIQVRLKAKPSKIQINTEK
jgi:hypothetical protein